MIDRNTREDHINKNNFLGWVQPNISLGANPVLNLFNKREPGGCFQGGSEDGNPKVFETNPLGAPFDFKDSTNVGKVSGVAVRGEDLAFIIIYEISRGFLVFLKLSFE